MNKTLEYISTEGTEEEREMKKGKIIKKVKLVRQNENHNKYYVITLVKHNKTKWQVLGVYGPLATNEETGGFEPRCEYYNASPMYKSEELADKEFTKRLATRHKHKYKTVQLNDFELFN